MELKVPPVVVFIICMASMFGFYYLSKNLSLDFLFRIILSRAFLAMGVLSGTLGILNFRMNSTTVDPSKPEKASSLVTSGIYQYTRNPMYLGMAFVLIGGGIRIGNPLGLLSIIFFIWYMTQFQIKPEEKALLKKFGDKYQEYLDSVRRWI